jgi:hypothetical protein
MAKRETWYERLPHSIEARNRRKEPRPPTGRGWKRFVDLLGESPWGEVTTRRRIQEELKAGRMMCFEGTERSPTGRLQRMVWYKKVK